MTRLLLEHLWRPDGWLSPALVAIDAAGNIVEVTGADASARVDRRVSGYALPGMPNLHSHAFQRAMAGLAEHASSEADSFWTWRDVMYGVALQLSPDDVEAIATQLYVEMLKAGYTSVVEFQYLHKDPRGGLYAEPAELSLRIVRAAERAGIGLTLVPVLYRASGFGGKPPAESQRRFVLSTDELLGVVHRVAELHPGVRVGVAPHSLRAVSAPALAELLEGAGDGPVHIHVAEQQREVEECVAASGARPVEWLLANAPVDSSWCLVHATHVTAGELDGIARSGAVVGLCPTTEANLGDGVFPLAGFGGKLGIGSDSQVSVSVVEELRWLEYSQRLALKRRSVTRDAHSLWAAALAGGAQASDRPIGEVAPGRRADLIVLDSDHPALVERPLERVVDAFVFASSTPVVRDVMVGGRWVVEAGRHALDEPALAQFRAALRRLG